MVYLLFFVHIMLFVVVILALVSIVVCSMLMLIMLLLVLPGLLVVLYHLNIHTHYTIRGDSSSNGSPCGVFSVGTNFAAFVAGWYIGAALNCFILFYAWWWITI